MSADVKVSIRQQEIKDQVVHLTIFYKSYLQNLKYKVKSGCIFHLILVGILSISVLSIRPQSIVWFASVLPQKMGQVGRRKQKSSDFLKKNPPYIASQLPNMFC